MLSDLLTTATVSPWGVLAAAAMTLIALAVSWRLGLGLVRSISLSSIRSVLQLLLAGVLLVPALRAGAHLIWSWLWCFAMLIFAVGLVRRRTTDLGEGRPSYLLSALAVSVPVASGLAVVFCFGVVFSSDIYLFAVGSTAE